MYYYYYYYYYITKSGAYLESGVLLVGNADEVRHSRHVVLHAGTQRDRDLLASSVVRLSRGHDR